MDPIDEVHVAEPGLVVVDIAALDEETAVAVMSRLDEVWATSGVRPVRRVQGYGRACMRISDAPADTLLARYPFYRSP